MDPPSETHEGNPGPGTIGLDRKEVYVSPNVTPTASFLSSSQQLNNLCNIYIFNHTDFIVPTA